MKVLILLATILSALTEARYVTRASRDLVRHLKHKMERTYGLGLTGLIHPVTKEFNHAAVIEQRGGRQDYEKLGNTKDVGIHSVLGSVHNLLVQGANEKWMNIAGKDFDAYDFSAFFYGWIVALQEGFKGDGASNCFYASFALVQQVDYLVQDFNQMLAGKNMNFFNLAVFTPTHIQGNFAASYE